MKTLSSESSNIAWFKLADFVARGEKERALSVLRLLMYSVSNEALTHQLEGDILLAFNDLAAIQKYQHAAFLFKKSNQQHQAINAYLQALQLQEDIESLQQVLEMYVNIKHRTGICHSFSRLSKLLLQQNNFKTLQVIFNQIIENSDRSIHGILYAQMTIALLLQNFSHENITHYLEQSVCFLQSNTHFPHELQKFIAEIKTISPMLIKKIETLLKE